MDAPTIIAKVRDAVKLTEPEIVWFANGLASGEVTDAQAGAFAMAVCLKGIGEEGRVALTRAMRDSGPTLQWDMPGPIMDKHSTGGLGDCVSPVLAPALAAVGIYVPMISGRGLGHTGGTLDKLESVPGLITEVSTDRFREIVGDIGCAIVSASADMAPADRRLYAVRDVTATVESIDLITASILSKKLAAQLEGLVLDVKTGTGAFLTDPDEAEALARALVDTAAGAGCPTRALMTNMDEPLAPALGNAVEMIEVMECLTCTAPESRLFELTTLLGGELMDMAGLARSPSDGAGKIADAIRSGEAADRFQRMVSALGGPEDFNQRWAEYLPKAPVALPVAAGVEGIVEAFDGHALGNVVVDLGGGRRKAGADIDPAVGLTRVVSLGDRVATETPLAIVHASSQRAADRAADVVRQAIRIGSEPVTLPPLIKGRLI